MIRSCRRTTTRLGAKMPELIHTVSMLLGNLEDADPGELPRSRRGAAFIALAKATRSAPAGCGRRVDAP